MEYSKKKGKEIFNLLMDKRQEYHCPSFPFYCDCCMNRTKDCENKIKELPATIKQLDKIYNKYLEE